MIGATWGEINEGERVWAIPGARMKRGIEHCVPLTARTVEILTETRALCVEDRGDDAATLATRPLFPSPMNPRRELSNMAMLQLLDRMKTGATLPDGTAQTYRDVTTVHGLYRSTLATWARERTKFKDATIAAALAPTEKNAVAAAYSRADYLGERVQLTEVWAR